MKLPYNVIYDDKGPVGKLAPYVLTMKRFDGFYGRLHFYIPSTDYEKAVESYDKTYRCYAFCNERKCWVKVKIFKLYVVSYELCSDEDMKIIYEDYYES